MTFVGCDYRKQSGALSSEKHIFIKNGSKLHLFRGCHQTKCPFFQKMCPKKNALMPPMSRIGPEKMYKNDEKLYSNHSSDRMVDMCEK